MSFLFRYNLTNEHLTLILMILLLSLFSDLKEFNFWGLKGIKIEKNLKELEGQQAISTSEVHVSKKKLDEAERSVPIQLMDTSQSNFIALSFEIERLLRIYATIGLSKDVSNNININKLTKNLREKELLTDSGVKQLDAIRWLRNIIVHGRQNEINQQTLNAGIEIAYSLYNELYKQLYGVEPKLV